MLLICHTQDISFKPGGDPIKLDANIVRYAGNARRELDV